MGFHQKVALLDRRHIMCEPDVDLITELFHLKVINIYNKISFIKTKTLSGKEQKRLWISHAKKMSIKNRHHRFSL